MQRIEWNTKRRWKSIRKRIFHLAVEILIEQYLPLAFFCSHLELFSCFTIYKCYGGFSLISIYRWNCFVLCTVFSFCNNIYLPYIYIGIEGNNGKIEQKNSENRKNDFCMYITTCIIINVCCCQCENFS